MSHELARVDDAQRERCARDPDVCPVCDRGEPATPAHFGLCSLHCESEAFYRGDAPCPAVGPRGYLCTRPGGHVGLHVAAGAGHVCESWPGIGFVQARPPGETVAAGSEATGAQVPAYLAHLAHLAWAYRLAPAGRAIEMVIEGAILRALFAACEVHRLDPRKVASDPDAATPLTPELVAAAPALLRECQSYLALLQADGAECVCDPGDPCPLCRVKAAIAAATPTSDTAPTTITDAAGGAR